MDALKVNTPEELHQAIGKFLQSDYSRENLIVVYEDARKCANRFRVTYSALPKVPTYNNDPLDGLQEIGEWCDKSVKLVDDIVSDLDQQTINETIRQLKKLRGFADSVLSLVDTKLKEQAQKEARAKVEKEYKNLNEEASKTKGMLLILRTEVVMKLELEAHAILRRETKDAVQIYFSKDPTFKNRISQQDNEINKVLERLNKLVGSDTPTGKLLDIYCRLKSIPLQRQFDDVGYAYSPIDDWADVICGGCNRLYTSIDNVIKTFKEIQTKANLKTEETHPQKIQELLNILQIKPAHKQNQPLRDFAKEVGAQQPNASGVEFRDKIVRNIHLALQTASMIDPSGKKAAPKDKGESTETDQGSLQEIIDVLKNWQESKKTVKDFEAAKSALPPVAKTYDILCRTKGQCGAKTTDIIRWLGTAARDKSGYYRALFADFASHEVIADLEKWQEKPAGTEPEGEGFKDLNQIANTVHKRVQKESNKRCFQKHIFAFRKAKNTFAQALKEAQEAAIANPDLRYDYDEFGDKNKDPPKPPKA